jgi:hypothetical protein
VLKRQPAYLAYTQLLPDFIAASEMDRKVEVQNDFHPIAYSGDMLPLENPPLMVSWRGRHVPKDSDDLLTQLDARIVDNQGLVCYQVSGVTRDHLAVFIKDDVNQKTPCYQEYINIESLRMLSVAKRVISAFLHIHGYPAFSDHGDEVEEVVSEAEAEGTGEPSQKKGKGKRKHAALATIEEGSSTTHPIATSTTSPEEIYLKYAKPQRPNPLPWGAVDKIPNSDGLYMPFLLGLEKVDETMVPNLLSTYFLRCLGSDIPSCFETLRRLRSAFGVIAHTRCGHELAHLCKAIDIGLKAQVQIVPIFDGSVYQGSLLSGSRFTLLFGSNVYEPATYAALPQILREHSHHASSLKTIVELTGIDITECVTMRQMSQLLMKEAVRVELLDQVIALAKRVTFKEEFWPINPSTLKNFLDALGKYALIEDIPDSVPLHPSMLFERSVQNSLLAAFGFIAPCFNIPSCPQFKLQADLPCPPHFVIARTTILHASEQLTQILETGWIANNPRNLSKKNKDYPIPNKDAKEIWTLMCSLRTPPPLPVALVVTPVKKAVAKVNFDFV